MINFDIFALESVPWGVIYEVIIISDNGLTWRANKMMTSPFRDANMRHYGAGGEF